MTANYTSMDHQRDLILNHLKDMFLTFDADIIESVLLQRDWNVDRALDDLMAMSNGCTFNIPIEDGEVSNLTTQPTGDQVSDNNSSSEENENLPCEGNTSDRTGDVDDDVIVLDEEEYNLPAQSESDEEEPTLQTNETQIHQPEANPTPSVSYPTTAKKPSSLKPPAIVYTGYTSFDRIKRTRDSLERVNLFVKNSFKIMVILRGCPGSGKSTLANDILKQCGLQQNPLYYIHSIDNYFCLNPQGCYKFKKEKISAAVNWNQVNILHVMREGLTPVIVDNTHTRLWEMEKWASMAVCAGYEIEVIEPDTAWAFKVNELAIKTEHNIPEDAVRAMVDRYEHNVCPSTLLRTFNLEYSSRNLPPQPGSRILNNPDLKNVLDQVYNAVHVLPILELKSRIKSEKIPRLTKAEKKKRRKEQKRLEKQRKEDEALARGFVELEKLTEADSVDSLVDVNVDVDMIIPDELEDSPDSPTLKSESDKSWSTIEEGDESSDAESDDDEIDGSQDSDSSSSVDTLSESNVETPVVIDTFDVNKCFFNDKQSLILCPPDDPTQNECINTMVGRLRNPMNLGANEASVEAVEPRVHNLSNQLYDALTKNRPRLKCFENLRGENTEEAANSDECQDYGIHMTQERNTGLCMPKAYTCETAPPLQNVVAATVENPLQQLIVDSQSGTTLLPQENVINAEETMQVLKNFESILTVLPISSVLPIATSSECLMGLVSSPAVEPDLTNTIPPKMNCDDEPAFLESAEKVALSVTKDLTITEYILLESETREDVEVDSITNAIAADEVEDLISFNTSPTCKNDDELTTKDDLQTEANLTTDNKNDSNFPSDILSSDNNKFRSSNIEGSNEVPLTNDLLTESPDEASCSYKFKDNSSDVSTSLMKNVIANDLWGKSFEDGKLVEQSANDDKDVSDDSENSDSRSNSSSSENVVITDVHNTSNRFVNNDIKGDQVTERKKGNINRDNKNQKVDDGIDNIWNVTEPGVPELNTLKELILISSLDKAFNQSQSQSPSDEVDFQGLEQRENRRSNVPQRKSSTAFHIIENKLKDESKKDVVNVEHNDLGGNQVEEASSDQSDKYVKQWMRGDGWDDSPKDGESKRNDFEIKPPRKVQDSPSKQKNTETASIRLVNDIRNASDNSKMSLLLEKNKNHESGQQLLKSTNFQKCDYKENRPSSSTLNTMLDTPSKEDSIKSDFEAKSRSFNYKDEREVYDSQIINQLNSTYPSFFKNFEPNEQLWSGVTDTSLSWSTGETAKYVKPSDDSMDAIASRFNSLLKGANTSDYEKSWQKDKQKTSDLPEMKNNNFFLPAEFLGMERNKWTNTGIDDVTAETVHKVGHCREINQGRSSPDIATIELSYGCDKSTMTDGNCYTVKAKPQRQDLSNIFPPAMADIILDLYEKCSGNMDWIIEILMEDGYSPSDDQLEYLSSLQNVLEFQKGENDAMLKEKDGKEKKSTSRKRNRNRLPKNLRNQMEPKNFSIKQLERPVVLGKINQPTVLDQINQDDNVFSFTEDSGDSPELTSEEHVDLFLDLSTVSQLVDYYGNPTIYSVKDYQPVVKLPVSLARQLHAYLIGSVIDQAEENEDFINQLVEEDNFISCPTASVEEELSQNDVIEMENSLTDILRDSFPPATFGTTVEEFANEPAKEDRSADSFASKLSLSLLYRAFPTINSAFVRSTFKAQNFNYYATKNVLNQYGNEVPIDVPGSSPVTESDKLEDNDNIQLFGNQSFAAVSSTEVSGKVTEYRRNAAVNHRQWQKCRENLRSALQKKKLGVAAYYRDIMNAFKEKHEENNAQAAAILIDSCCVQNSDMIDLHYFKVTEALAALDKFLDHHILKLNTSGRSREILYIITGRGARSIDGVSRLQPPVKNRLKKRNIRFEIELHNTGLVKATIRRNSLMSTDL